MRTKSHKQKGSYPGQYLIPKPGDVTDSNAIKSQLVTTSALVWGDSTSDALLKIRTIDGTSLCVELCPR